MMQGTCRNKTRLIVFVTVNISIRVIMWPTSSHVTHLSLQYHNNHQHPIKQDGPLHQVRGTILHKLSVFRCLLRPGGLLHQYHFTALNATSVLPRRSSAAIFLPLMRSQLTKNRKRYSVPLHLGCPKSKYTRLLQAASSRRTRQPTTRCCTRFTTHTERQHVSF